MGYICGSYKKRTADCTAHFIRTDLLTAGVTENLRKVTSYAAKHEARFMKLLTEQTEDGSKRRNAAKKKELEAAEKRIAELSAIFKRLYEDSVTGRISDERFTELSADYEAEQKELKEKAAALQSELSKTLEATANAEKFMKVVRKYTSFEELTPTLLREFVEKIVIHESEALDGKRRGKLRRQETVVRYFLAAPGVIVLGNDVQFVNTPGSVLDFLCRLFGLVSGFLRRLRIGRSHFLCGGVGVSPGQPCKKLVDH